MLFANVADLSDVVDDEKKEKKSRGQEDTERQVSDFDWISNRAYLMGV